MNTLIINKEVEEVKEELIKASEPGRVIYYLPHLPVIKENKVSTKIRPVFECSAKTHQGISLNDQLLAGPKTQQSISFLMIHLRLNPVVVLADIVRMFYAINYNEEPEDSMQGLLNNRDLFRFIWTDNKNDQPKIYRFIKVLMGSKSSPFQASSVILYHLNHLIENSNNELTIECCRLLKKFMYVDDVLMALSDEQKAVEVSKEVVRIFETMNMTLNKFVSNSREVLKHVPQDYLGPNKDKKEVPTAEDISKPTKMLGTMWDPKEDTFTFPYMKLLEQPIAHTKRGLSKLIPAIYDVNGELAPYIMRGKAILSMAWAYEKPSNESEGCTNETENGIRKRKSNKLDWDETLPPHIDKLFKEWIEDLKFVDEFKTTRYVFGTKDGVFETPPPRKLLEMHAFSDGGNDAYGIVIYLRWKSNGSYQMKRIYAASRIVSKSNNMSVPRKELNGRVMAVKRPWNLQQNLRLQWKMFIYIQIALSVYIG